MGYEVKYTCHPRKEDGGYDTETTEEKTVKVGKPFDDTPLEKLAAGIMAQLARRDIWVIDVKVVELVRRDISFKECKDGRGIMLKNKRFSFNESAQMIAEDVLEQAPPGVSQSIPQVPMNLQPHQLMVQPHNVAQPHNSLDSLYSNPNSPVPVQRAPIPQNINQKKLLYKVIFDPGLVYMPEVRRLGLKFTEDREYPVHEVIPYVTAKGDVKLDAQKIAVTDDLGRVQVLDEKYFTTAGRGLLADRQLNFSGSNGRGVRKPRLAYENEMYSDAPNPNMGAGMVHGIPVDDGTVPMELMAVPELRRSK